MDNAYKIAKFKYPPTTYTVCWIFDQSCFDKAYADDALNAKMNVRPGGAQPAMRDTIWAGKVQKMTMPDGTPKGLRMVLLKERGILDLVLSNYMMQQ